jgi:hypothetical protein
MDQTNNKSIYTVPCFLRSVRNNTVLYFSKLFRFSLLTSDHVSVNVSYMYLFTDALQGH